MLSGLDVGKAISIHALREEGDGSVVGVMMENCIISIHALREEGDGLFPFREDMTGKFLSTPSARRATVAWRQSAEFVSISIHALREEGDPL